MIPNHSPYLTTLGWCGPTDPAWRSLLDALPKHLLPTTEILRPCDLEDWINEPTELPPTTNRTLKSKSSKQREINPNTNKRLLIACEHRNDPNLATALRLLNPKPHTRKPTPNSSIPVALVLGEDWQGHRRTFPLPDDLDALYWAFYWYEWFDKTIPWLLSEPTTSELTPKNALKPPKDNATRNHNRPINPRVEKILNFNLQLSRQLNDPKALNQLTNSLWWILSDQPDTTSLWCQLLNECGVRTVGSLLGEPHPTLQPDCILLAPQSRPHNPSSSTTTHTPTLNRLREDHPNAFLALVCPFPRWCDWPELHRAGLNAITGFPNSPQGLLTNWLLQHA